jgi:hypothetical protein
MKQVSESAPSFTNTLLYFKETITCSIVVLEEATILTFLKAKAYSLLQTNSGRWNCSSQSTEDSSELPTKAEDVAQ